MEELDDERIKSLRLISSGDNDCGIITESLLKSKQSFFSVLDGSLHCYSHTENCECYDKDEGYIFLNDKSKFFECPQEKTRCIYLPSVKDKIYTNISAGGMREQIDEYHTNGSVIGTVFYIKNDEPNRVGIKAILTINTFGGKLLHEEKGKTYIKDFAKSFYEKVLCSYRALLISELAQMLIRHQIKQGIRNPITGESIRLIANDIDPNDSLKKRADLAFINSIKYQFGESMNRIGNDINARFNQNKELYDHLCSALRKNNYSSEVDPQRIIETLRSKDVL